MFADLRDRCVSANTRLGDYGYLGDKRMRETLNTSQDIINFLNNPDINDDIKYYIRRHFEQNIPQITIRSNPFTVAHFQGSDEALNLVTSHLVIMADYLKSKNEEGLLYKSRHQSIFNNVQISGGIANSQIQQATSNSSQNISITDSNNIILAALKKLESDIKNEVNSSDKLDAICSNIDLLKSQIILPAELKNSMLMKKAWDYLSKLSDLTSVGAFCYQHKDFFVSLIG
ncbi:MAG: hypothetical protein WC635_04190 [Bacteriovorax sp.]|jgi:hypothetical protein